MATSIGAHTALDTHAVAAWLSIGWHPLVHCAAPAPHSPLAEQHGAFAGHGRPGPHDAASTRATPSRALSHPTRIERKGAVSLGVGQRPRRRRYVLRQIMQPPAPCYLRSLGPIDDGAAPARSVRRSSRRFGEAATPVRGRGSRERGRGRMGAEEGIDASAGGVDRPATQSQRRVHSGEAARTRLHGGPSSEGAASVRASCAMSHVRFVRCESHWNERSRIASAASCSCSRR